MFRGQPTAQTPDKGTNNRLFNVIGITECAVNEFTQLQFYYIYRADERLVIEIEVF